MEEKTAYALRYDADSGDMAPTLTASGKGFVAEEILRLAKEHRIPLRQDAALAGALSSLHVGDTIPPELYKAVAAVLVFVYKLHGKKGIR